MPGAEGDFQVLSDHAPVMTAMRAGVVGIDDAEGSTVASSCAGVLPTRARRVLSCSPKPLSRLRISSADTLGEEIKNAEEDLADAKDEQKQLAQEKLDRLRELKDAIKL